MGEYLKLVTVFVLPVLGLVILMGSYAYFFGEKADPAALQAQQQEEVKSPFANASPFELKLKGKGKGGKR
ncbi:MAG: hypothetical protein OXB87_00865 [Hyphomicrobiales bacterium]|nr:hypothetical protein [Hyphomicrobiales bacterium]